MKKYFLALNRIDQVGPRMVLKLLRLWPNLEELFQSPLKQIEQAGVSRAVAERIAGFSMDQIEADLRWQEARGHYLLTWADPEYPTLLKEIPDLPIVLYAKGNLDALQYPAVAVVGTRKPSVTGSETAWRFAFELALKNIIIVSGLALGIDAQAHSGCIEASGRTIAVMGTGMDTIYPRRHWKLADKITQNGLLLSEFPLKSPPMAGHFPRRNRIISGLSLATLVVEAAIRSGSLITARFALEQNREVLAVPGSIYNPEARGCHYLLQQGARLVASTQDIFDELGMTYSESSAKGGLALARENENLVQCMGFETTSVDQIVLRSGLSLETVVCDLAALEVEGIVKAVPGGYMRCNV